MVSLRLPPGTPSGKGDAYDTAVAQRPSASTPPLKHLSPSEDPLRNTWFYDVVVGAGGQTVLPLCQMKGADHFVHLVFNKGVTRYAPAALVIKTSLADVSASKTAWRPPNATLRVESGLVVKTGTLLQFGYNISQGTHAEQAWYTRQGMPVADYISVETALGVTVAGWRTELGLQQGSPMRLKAVARDALWLGGSITWTCMFINPQTGRRRRVDMTAVLKAETNLQTGTMSSGEPLERKAEIELQIRLIDPALQHLSLEETHSYVAQGADKFRQLSGISRVPAVTAAGGDSAVPATDASKATPAAHAGERGVSPQVRPIPKRVDFNPATLRWVG